MEKRPYPNRMNKDLLTEFKIACVLNDIYQGDKMDELIEEFFEMDKKDIKAFVDNIKKEKTENLKKTGSDGTGTYRKGEYANKKAFTFSLKEDNVDKFKEFCEQESLLVYEFLEALIDQWLKKVGVRNADFN